MVTFLLNISRTKLLKKILTKQINDMMKKLLFFSAFMAFSFFATAQNVGDYQSVTGSGLPWQNTTTWQTWDGTAWQPAADYPANAGDITYTVTIVAASEVLNSLSSDLTVGSGGTLTVASGGILSINSTNSSQLIIASGAAVTVDGELNCDEDITNGGNLIVNGTLANVVP